MYYNCTFCLSARLHITTNAPSIECTLVLYSGTSRSPLCTVSSRELHNCVMGKDVLLWGKNLTLTFAHMICILEREATSTYISPFLTYSNSCCKDNSYRCKSCSWCASLTQPHNSLNGVQLYTRDLHICNARLHIIQVVSRDHAASMCTCVELRSTTWHPRCTLICKWVYTCCTWIPFSLQVYTRS